MTASAALAETAGAIMTRRVVTLTPDDTVPAIAAKLAQHAISAAPVVDHGGEVVGMVSEDDLMRRFGAAAQSRSNWWLNLLAEGEQLAPEFLDYIRLDRRRAAELMTRPVVAVAESMPVAEIADLLMKKHIKRVPVLRGGKLVGIVSRADIVRAMARTPVQAK
ncbi:MAG: hypothetical protein B7Z80_10025 [Rhodospirillales bacterium 20-64-7]|nr:MAG: hypothetical protein B7Z80_10025 [Rhodospirillales bacterium 20-64-7]